MKNVEEDNAVAMLRELDRLGVGVSVSGDGHNLLLVPAGDQDLTSETLAKVQELKPEILEHLGKPKR